MNASKLQDGEYKCGFCLGRFDTYAQAEHHCSNLVSPPREYERKSLTPKDTKPHQESIIERRRVTY